MGTSERDLVGGEKPVRGMDNTSSLWLHRVEDLQALLFPEEPLAVDNCWGRKNHSFSRMWPLVGIPCSSGWPHTHAHMGNTNCTLWVRKRKRGGKGMLKKHGDGEMG